jgi:hypothetical protein
MNHGDGRMAIWRLLVGTLSALVAVAAQAPEPTPAPAPFLEKRADPMTDRTDFFAWASGLDNTCAFPRRKKKKKMLREVVPGAN